MPLIGEGNYGCVFKPYIKCKNEHKIGSSKTKVKTPNNAKVGKVFVDNLEFNNEKEIQEIIAKIDPKNEFTVPLYEDCNVNSFKDSNSADKCMLINTKIKTNYYQLIYRDGGVSFKDLLKLPGSPTKFLILLSKLKPILLGIEKLNNARYVHQDIKPPNILFDTHKISLIDFGIMTHVNQIYNQDNMYVLRYNYPYYPPEYKLFVYKKNTFPVFYRNFLENFDFIFNIGGKQVDLLHNISSLGINIETELQALYSKKFDNHVYSTDKIDIYSLGIVLLEFFIWSGIFNKDYKDYKNENIKNMIIEFIKGMIHFNIDERYDFKTLIKQYDNLNSNLSNLI